MRRLLLDSLCRQLLPSRDQFLTRHWLSSGSRPFSQSRKSILTPLPFTRLKATRATAITPKNNEALWDHDVTEREVTVCPMTSLKEAVTSQHGDLSVLEGVISERNSDEPLSAEDVMQPNPVTPTRPQLPPTASPTKASTTAPPPPYLDFDSARPFSEMPAPFSLPVIGTLWMHMPGGPLHGLTFEEKNRRLQEMYGSTFRERVVFGHTVVHLFRPEDMEAVYRVQGARPRRDSFRMLDKYYKLYGNGVQGLLSSQGEEWYKVRSSIQGKMMKPKSASAYLDLHNAVSDDFITYLERLRGPDGVIEDLLPELYKFAMEGVGCVCFNRRLGALETDIPADSDTYRFIQAVGEVMEISGSETSKLFLFRHSPSFRRLVKAQSFITQLSRQEMQRTLNSFAQTNREVDGESGDLIPYLMTKTDLSEQHVLTIISECFFAGVDTTSHLLGFCLYLLTKHPEVQDKLVEEINHSIPANGAITARTLGSMKYLRAVMKETFRCNPVTPGNGRTLPRDVVLSGYRVPAGTFLALHHDWTGKSNEYVKDADRFEPQRWLRSKSSDPLGDMHSFIYMPFGFGSRSCLGRRFAEQEFYLGLIKILQNYRVEYAHTEDLWYEMFIVNKPMTPLRFRFLPRK